MYMYIHLSICIYICIYRYAYYYIIIIFRCPNWCNQRGICTNPQEGGYCDCNIGFTGDDCSKRVCPMSFEPLTLASIPLRRTVRLKTNVESGLMSGKYEFTFAGKYIYVYIYTFICVCK
jgi:hypothetical protein